MNAHVWCEAYGNNFDIPIQTLFAQGCGDLICLDADVVDRIVKMVPIYQSAFDAALPTLRNARTPIDGSERGVLESVMEARLIWDERLEIKAERMVGLLLDEGINAGNDLQLKWIAVQGPMPLHVNPEAPAVTADMQETLCMRVALYKLIDIIRKADLTSEHKVGCAQDVQYILSPSWSGIYGWRH